MRMSLHDDPAFPELPPALTLLAVIAAAMLAAGLLVALSAPHPGAPPTYSTPLPGITQGADLT